MNEKFVKKKIVVSLFLDAGVWEPKSLRKRAVEGFPNTLS